MVKLISWSIKVVTMSTVKQAKEGVSSITGQALNWSHTCNETASRVTLRNLILAEVQEHQVIPQIQEPKMCHHNVSTGYAQILLRLSTLRVSQTTPKLLKLGLCNTFLILGISRPRSLVPRPSEDSVRGYRPLGCWV